MKASLRSALSALGVAFTAYLAVGGMFWTSTPQQPLLMVAMIALYLVTVWLCIFWGSGTTPLPLWLTALALLAAVLVPNVTWFAAGDDVRLQTWATWGLGGISALLAILVVRRRVWAAWIGVVILAVSGSFWIGIVSALSLGAVGAVVWVGIAQLVTGLMARAARDTAELTELQRSSSEWLASQSGRRRERRVTVQRAIALAGPVLTRVIETGASSTTTSAHWPGCPRGGCVTSSAGVGCSTTRCGCSWRPCVDAAPRSRCSTRAVSTVSRRRS